MTSAARIDPRALCTRLEWIEVCNDHPADFRRLVSAHRQALTLRLRAGDGDRIAQKVADIRELFDLWGFSGDLN